MIYQNETITQKTKAMKTVYLAQKKSGNYTVSNYCDSAWKQIAVCNSPKELLNAVDSLGKFATVIKAEYSQSQLKTTSGLYRQQDALRAFGLPVSKANLTTWFA